MPTVLPLAIMAVQPTRIVVIPRQLRGTAPLPPSKSIANRALIIAALCVHFEPESILNLPESSDTRALLDILHAFFNSKESEFNAGDAGTAFRFLTAFFAIQPGTQVLSGSPRMHERPIGPLVDALNALGCSIEYLEKTGFPPLKIGAPKQPMASVVPVNAAVSSQFLSALLMIGPALPAGLTVIPDTRVVSAPYIALTLSVMRHFGASVEALDQGWKVAPGVYTMRPFVIESDWSAASYWYGMVALSSEASVFLPGLTTPSAQGDAVVADWMRAFGVETAYLPDGARITKESGAVRPYFEKDFTDCPDLAQTFAVVCAGLGIKGLFSGLETLAIKETNRLKALKTELAKVGVSFSKLPPHFSKKNPDRTFYLLEGTAQWSEPPVFDTHGDHRMAMALAMLGVKAPVVINHLEVVKKSYPEFWSALENFEAF